MRHLLVHSQRFRFVMWLVIGLTINASGLAAAAPPARTMEVRPGRSVELRADPRNYPVHVPAPRLPGFNAPGPRRTDSVTIDVNFNPSIACPPATTVPWPADAQAAFLYAINIWRGVVNGPRTIVINACWSTGMPANTLGNTGPTSDYKNFPGAPQADTWYPVALANQLSNQDLNGAAAEINGNFNSTVVWYYGTDGNTPLNQYDLVSVVLHEIGHGLGFLGTMAWDDGTLPNECTGLAGIGCWGSGNPLSPDVYDRALQNGAGQNLITQFDNVSIQLGNQLIGNALYFNGPHATAANGGSPPRLYAPSTWQGGSSVSHLDENTYNGTLNALMTPALGAAESVHYPGEISLGILADLGWTVPDLSNMFVDSANTGYEDGSLLHPFNTVLEGVNAVGDFGHVWIQTGNYPGAITVSRPMTLHAINSIVVIGAPVMARQEEQRP